MWDGLKDIGVLHNNDEKDHSDCYQQVWLIAFDWRYRQHGAILYIGIRDVTIKATSSVNLISITVLSGRKEERFLPNATIKSRDYICYDDLLYNYDDFG